MIELETELETQNASVKGRREKLLAFVCEVRSVRDELTLHALVFVAQDLGLLDTEYEFDFSNNVPFSMDLSRDLFDLAAEGRVVDTKGPSTIYAIANNVTDVKTNLPSPQRAEDYPECTAQQGIHSRTQDIRRLSHLNPAVILTLSRILTLFEPRQDAYFPEPEHIIGILTEREMVYRRYAEEAVNFCTKEGILHRRRKCQA